MAKFVVGLVGLISIVVALIGFCCFDFFNEHIVGNKQVFDLNQNFSYALVSVGDKTLEVEVKKWNDYIESDTIQIVTYEGQVFYTHSNNVILSNKKIMK